MTSSLCYKNDMGRNSSITNSILVTSNVARDFMQNAAYFNTTAKVVWEYVSNSLDNPMDGQPVSVVVEIGGRKISISDNASGMSRADLKSFFQMHGENVQRARGRRVRGRFGQGNAPRSALRIAFV